LGGLNCQFFLLLGIEFHLHGLLLLLLELDLFLNGKIVGLSSSSCLIGVSWGSCLLFLHFLLDVEVGLLLGVTLVKSFLLHSLTLLLLLLGSSFFLLLSIEVRDVILHGIHFLVTS
jgi:hypothetical protein